MNVLRSCMESVGWLNWLLTVLKTHNNRTREKGEGTGEGGQQIHVNIRRARTLG